MGLRPPPPELDAEAVTTTCSARWISHDRATGGRYSSGCRPLPCVQQIGRIRPCALCSPAAAVCAVPVDGAPVPDDPCCRRCGRRLSQTAETGGRGVALSNPAAVDGLRRGVPARRRPSEAGGSAGLLGGQPLRGRPADLRMCGGRRLRQGDGRLPALVGLVLPVHGDRRGTADRPGRHGRSGVRLHQRRPRHGDRGVRRRADPRRRRHPLRHDLRPRPAGRLADADRARTTAAPVRDAARADPAGREPARRGRRPGGQAALERLPRPPDRAAQPGHVLRPRRARAGAGRPRRPLRRGAADRPRRVQGRQRHPRTRLRRRGARARGAPAPARRPPRRHPRAAERRRVRGAAGRHVRPGTGRRPASWTPWPSRS